MSEIVFTPNYTANSEVLNNVSFPLEKQNWLNQINETQKRQKSVSGIEDSEEKKRKKQRLFKKKNNKI